MHEAPDQVAAALELFKVTRGNRARSTGSVEPVLKGPVKPPGSGTCFVPYDGQHAGFRLIVALGVMFCGGAEG